MNIATDIAIGVLPLPMLKELQLPKRQKIALMIVFGLGGLYELQTLTGDGNTQYMHCFDTPSPIAIRDFKSHRHNMAEPFGSDMEQR